MGGFFAFHGYVSNKAIEHSFESTLLTENAQLRLAVEEARTEAQRANCAKSDFLAAMSHELRTPLNAIAGYTQLLQLGLRGSLTPEQQDDLDRIAYNQRHLLDLINSVLNFAKLEAGSILYEITEVPLDQLLHDIESLIRPQMEAKGLDFMVAIPEPLTVRADQEKLWQLVCNLLDNALKFTRPGGTVTVRAFSEKAQTFLTVHDTGVGIPINRLDRIFEPFMQVNRTLSTVQAGVGLGLAISRDLATGMGGDITVRSEMGCGTTFTVSLPHV
jgi:signal transduction histidine kinase